MNDQDKFQVLKLWLDLGVERTFNMVKRGMGLDREGLSERWGGFPLSQMGPREECLMLLDEAVTEHWVGTSKAASTLYRMGGIQLKPPPSEPAPIPPYLAMLKASARLRRLAREATTEEETNRLREMAHALRVEAEAMQAAPPPQLPPDPQPLDDLIGNLPLAGLGI